MADLNGDGVPDIVVAGAGTTLVVLSGLGNLGAVVMRQSPIGEIDIAARDRSWLSRLRTIGFR